MPDHKRPELAGEEGIQRWLKSPHDFRYPFLRQGNTVDDLLQRFREDGWSFITFEEALKDEVYKLKYGYVGVQGAGHLDAIKPITR